MHLETCLYAYHKSSWLGHRSHIYSPAENKASIGSADFRVVSGIFSESEKILSGYIDPQG